MFKRKTKTPPGPTRKRLQTLTKQEVFEWSETLSFQIGRGFASWRRGGGDVVLADVEKAISALLEVCYELRSRETS